MPENSTQKVQVNVMLRPDAKERLTTLAHEHHTSRSTVIRAALSVAAGHPQDLAKKIEEIG